MFILPNPFKVAITSQNMKSITGHAGKCSGFFIFTVKDKKIEGSDYIRLSQEETFHNSGHSLPGPLSGVHCLITAGMGQGLMNKLQNIGIDGVITKEPDPQTAVEKYINGSLERFQAHTHEKGHHHH